MKTSIIYCFFMLLAMRVLHAQTPLDAIMMEKSQVCTALIYDYTSWDKYWEGDYLRSNGNIGTFSRQTIMPMAAIGLHDKINLIVTMPYVKTEASEGQLVGASGFQDLGLALKGELAKKTVGKGNFSLLGTLAYAFPISNYTSDYMPFSIGMGTNELTARAISQYHWDMGLYVRASGAFLWRGQTEIERDYYYNNGSYYTSWMDVPNAWQFQGAIGWWFLQNTLRVEMSYLQTKCPEGDDIRTYNAPQPTNKVESAQGIALVQYYGKNLKGFGVMAYFNHVFSGRNTGEATGIGGGVTYLFTY